MTVGHEVLSLSVKGFVQLSLVCAHGVTAPGQSECRAVPSRWRSNGMNGDGNKLGVGLACGSE